jgi:hypothetical protein
MSRLGAALKIHPGEGRVVALLVGLMLCIAAGSTIGGSVTDAIFFARFGVRFLPFMYIVLGVVTSAASLGVTILLGRMPRGRLYLALPLALAGMLVGHLGIKDRQEQVALEPARRWWRRARAR